MAFLWGPSSGGVSSHGAYPSMHRHDEILTVTKPAPGHNHPLPSCHRHDHIPLYCMRISTLASLIYKGPWCGLHTLSCQVLPLSFPLLNNPTTSYLQLIHYLHWLLITRRRDTRRDFNRPSPDALVPQKLAPPCIPSFLLLHYHHHPCPIMLFLLYNTHTASFIVVGSIAAAQLECYIPGFAPSRPTSSILEPHVNATITSSFIWHSNRPIFALPSFSSEKRATKALRPAFLNGGFIHSH